ncbi:MAG: hypothetical protein KDK26_01870 [Roseivivax sp.]|nr:hypothetical protein [Roseivivax sp.]
MTVHLTDLQEWIMQALDANGGSATIVQVAKWIWDNKEADLRNSGDRFYRWQYEMRWEAQKLRDLGLLEKDKTTKNWVKSR